MAAIESEATEMALLLLAKGGVNVERCVYPSGRAGSAKKALTALVLAVRLGNLEVVKALLAAGAQPDAWHDPKAWQLQGTAWHSVVVGAQNRCSVQACIHVLVMWRVC